MTLSALIIARNEEKKIELTLKSLSFVDEIVVILDRSIDDTFKPQAFPDQNILDHLKVDYNKFSAENLL